MKNIVDRVRLVLAKDWPITIIIIGAFIFYVPYIASQFVSDDWLWLYNAKRALTNPIVFLQRPMMGYFRPLNMIIVFIWLNIFGPNPRVFSIINILLHCVNIWLLWKVLIKYNISKEIALISSFIFAFYCINAAAIEWICVGHDLWVTSLILLMIIILKDFVEKPSMTKFLILWACGFGSTLIKESGFISLGIYFLLFILLKISPFGQKYRKYTVIMLITYFIFLIIYFMTRTVADRQLVLGLETISNLWYFSVYVIFPFPPRMTSRISPFFIDILTWIRIILTFAYPFVLVIVFLKSKPIIRLFVLLPTFFVSTIAIFRWGHNLFSLHPADTAARFMYSPAVGFAVVTGVTLTYVSNNMLSKRTKKAFLIIFGAFFIIINSIALHWLSNMYIQNQILTTKVIEQLEKIRPELERCNNLIVYTDHIEHVTPVIFSDIRLKAIIFIKFDKIINVSIKENRQYIPSDLMFDGNNMVIYWDNVNVKFITPF
jgi:hypothetical protein